MPAQSATTARNLGRLRRLVRGRKRAVIILQNNPDPDAIASASALRHLLKETGGCDSIIVYGGVIGRAENRSMLKYLNLTMRNINDVSIENFDIVAMVDTQPGFGNNPVDDHRKVHIVIDHHERAPRSRNSSLTDIRPNYGASSSILTEYLQAAGMPPGGALATALAYGIQSDTQDFGRETSDFDIQAYTYLYPLANKRWLSRIENEQEPREYFTAVSRALLDSRTYANTALCWLGRIMNPDMTGEIADLLVRCDEIDWALCQGLYKGTLYVSLRTDFRNANADGVVRRLIRGIGRGGGHEMLAGAQVTVERDSLKSATKIVKQIERRFLDDFKLDPKSRRPLVSRARPSHHMKPLRAASPKGRDTESRHVVDWGS